MPRPSQKDKILDAALECFAYQGYSATRIRNIAERADVSEAALYRHYATKEAVAQELFSFHLQDFSSRLSPITAAARPARERLSEVIRLFLTVFREKPAAFRFVVLTTPSFMPNVPAGTVYPLDVIEQIIATGQAEGTIRPGQPNL